MREQKSKNERGKLCARKKRFAFTSGTQDQSAREARGSLSAAAATACALTRSGEGSVKSRRVKKGQQRESSAEGSRQQRIQTRTRRRRKCCARGEARRLECVQKSDMKTSIQWVQGRTRGDRGKRSRAWKPAGPGVLVTVVVAATAEESLRRQQQKQRVVPGLFAPFYECVKNRQRNDVQTSTAEKNTLVKRQGVWW